MDLNLNKKDLEENEATQRLKNKAIWLNKGDANAIFFITMSIIGRMTIPYEIWRMIKDLK